MSFHNVRDKYGRFTKTPVVNPKAKRKHTKKTKVTTPSVILNGFLIDASGSMQEGGKYKSVITGFNELVEQGKKDAVTTGVTNRQFVAFFGATYKEVSHEVSKLIEGGYQSTSTGQTSHKEATAYYPNMGMTALWESTAKLISKLEVELTKSPGAKVILTIFTDGEENNSSYEWRDGTRLKAIIEQKQKEGWVITFIGAGEQNLMERVATSVGIFASNALGYQNTAKGTRSAMAKMSASRSSYTAAVADGLDTNVGFFAD